MTDTRELVERLRELTSHPPHGNLHKAINKAADTIESLAARLAAAEKDAGRWKFCEVNGFPRHMVPHAARHSFRDSSKEATPATDGYWIATIEKTQESFRGNTVAAAIDAARSERGKP